MNAAQSIDYSIAFMTGLLASGHCVGMCGSLVSAFFLRMGDKAQGFMPYAAYHAARLGVYAMAGIAAAALGMALVGTGILGKAQGILQIAAGLIVILLGLDILGIGLFRLPLLRVPISLFQGIFLRATERGVIAGSAMGGLLNGIMPCSLTLAMAVKATTAPSPLEGGMLMLAFGAGTLPSMIFVATIFRALGARARGLLMKAAALFVIGLGLFTLVQGITYFNVVKNLPNWVIPESHHHQH